tara:strand:+ start:108 stop:599 length:492 start_codon:yes stop_codon:yes gene_type:complete
MAWAKNGTPDTLGSTGDVLTISDLSAKKFNVILDHELATGNIDNANWTFNNNTNSVYAYRHTKNGASDSATVAGQPGILYNIGDGAWDRHLIGYVCSISGEEKLVIMFGVAGNTAGAGNAPDRIEEVGKFVPSPDADITRIDDTNAGTGSFDTSSNISAHGTD